LFAGKNRSRSWGKIPGISIDKGIVEKGNGYDNYHTKT